MSLADPPRGLRASIAFGVMLLHVGLGAAGWGSLTGYLAHPARAGAVVLGLVVTAVALLSDINFSSGKREDVRNRWILLPSVAFGLSLAWLLPYLDRRGIWVIDGDAARYLGLAVLAAGGVLRIWPMFVLGRRFSALVAIQQDHELVTDGVYRCIRHPSYLGALVGHAGWVLVFRSGVGLVLVFPMLGLILARIEAEEALLASEFGSTYAEYRSRTRRLLPGVY